MEDKEYRIVWLSQKEVTLKMTVDHLHRVDHTHTNI